MRLKQPFPERYGAWALVAGASEGIGAAFAYSLARRGMNLVLAARRVEPLTELAEKLRAEFGPSGLQILCLNGDLGSPDFLESLAATCSTLDLGLLIYNAAHSPIGEFVDLPVADVLRVVDVNVRGPVTLVHALLPQMKARGRGGVILLSSLASMTGAPRVATYAASKAFNRILAQALWYEMKDSNIDVMACCPTATRTPGYRAAADKDPPGTLEPEQVAEEALDGLGRGPVLIPGRFNRVADVIMSRVLSRKRAILIMGDNTSALVQAKPPKGSS